MYADTKLSETQVELQPSRGQEAKEFKLGRVRPGRRAEGGFASSPPPLASSSRFSVQTPLHRNTMLPRKPKLALSAHLASPFEQRWQCSLLPKTDSPDTKFPREASLSGLGSTERERGASSWCAELLRRRAGAGAGKGSARYTIMLRKAARSVSEVLDLARDAGFAVSYPYAVCRFASQRGGSKLEGHRKGHPTNGGQGRVHTRKAL